VVRVRVRVRVPVPVSGGWSRSSPRPLGGVSFVA